jgi:hypothetical protein
MRKLDLLDRCPEARARERVAPATAAVGGLDRRVGEGSPRALPESDARAAAVIDDCQPGRPHKRRDDLYQCPITVEPVKRLPDRRGVNRGIIEWNRLGHAVERLHAGQRRSQPLPHARHRLDRDDLAAVATSARVSLSVPAAMSTTLRPGRRSSRSASHPSGLVRVVRPGAFVIAYGPLPQRHPDGTHHASGVRQGTPTSHLATRLAPHRTCQERASGCLLAPAGTVRSEVRIRFEWIHRLALERYRRRPLCSGARRSPAGYGGGGTRTS